ncbi:MAG: chromate transporter [Opitutaceae bacterium]|nr:chromate transporter [Cytophagales bacterium]
MDSVQSSIPYSLKDLALYFIKLGTWGFGGPVALIGYMHRDLVENKKWISDEDYKEGLALSQLAPGPLAAQLSIYLGYVHYNVIGATIVGIAFVLPSFLMVLAIGWAYVHFGGLPWMQGLFYGVGAAVIGIITMSSYKLTLKSLGKDLWLWGIFAALMISTFLLEEENIWLILGSGVLIWLLKSPPNLRKTKVLSVSWPVLLQVATTSVYKGKLWQIAWFFTKAGAFVFGSGLAIVPFLYGGVVKDFKWLTEQQFVDAVAVAMITPGPVVITVGFIGYLVSGFSGACVAAASTFLPCYFFTILPAPYFKKYGKHPGIKAFIEGVTAAAVGAIAGAVLVLAKRTITDPVTILLAVSAAVVIYRYKKIQEPIIILVAGLIGLGLTIFK